MSMAIENDDQLVERLVPKILSSIRAKARAVESLDIKADLEGITSIPCYDTSGGIFKQVLVEMNALKEPAFSAGQTASDAAQRAYEAARNATEGEALREEAEEQRVLADNQRKEDYAAIREDLITGNKILVVSEDEYEEALDSGTIDETKLYFAYEL